jgi:hypothetical protein
MALEASIQPHGSGTIGGNAIVNVLAVQNISAPGTVLFAVANGNFMGTGGGTIGGDATLNISAVNLTTGALFADIFNYGGAQIGRDAIISLNVSNSFTATGNAEIGIFSSGGIITRDASINVTAGDITAPSLTAEIDNTAPGSIGGNAAINMNVSGTATVTNDATVAIYGSDGAAAAAINFNSGSYDAGGTFSAFTDGAGTITFNNASVHADVLKVGALGTNGVLNIGGIGGGTLSADTTLKLYANSSTGTVNFTADVTLTGASTKIIAGDTVKVFDSVVVTIGMSPVDIYTNHAHYSSVNGGDGTTTGIFTSSGLVGPAVTTHLGVAPPAFDDLPPPATPTTTSGTSSTKISSPTLSTTSVTTSTKVSSPTLSTTTTTGTTSTKVKSATLSSTNVTNAKTTGTVMNVSSSDQLLSMLDGAALGPDGKIAISGSKSTSNSGNSSRINAAGRLNAGRHAAEIRDARSLPGKRFL